MPATTDIAAALTTAMAAIKLDKLISAAGADTDVADSSLLAQMVSKNVVAGASVADWTTFSPLTDSLEAVRDQGDAAWRTGAGAAADLSFVPTAAVRTWSTPAGDTGVVGDMAVLGGVNYVTQEVNAGNLLEVELTFTHLNAVGTSPANISVWGRYQGSTSHFMTVQARHYVDSTWEDIGTMTNAGAITAYQFPLNPGHIKTDGEMKIRFIHTAGTGILSHYLHLDKVEIHTRSAVASILEAVVEGTITLADATRIMLSALNGVSDGIGTPTVHTKSMDTLKTRITATIDASGNRTVVTRDGTL